MTAFFTLRWWFFCLCCLPLMVQADNLAPIDLNSSKIELAKHLWYFEDKNQQLSIQQIQQQRQGWQLQPHEKPYFGYSASAFWLKVEIGRAHV